MSAVATNKPILVINEELNEAIRDHGIALKEMLVLYEIPTNRWADIWTDLEEENALFSEMDEDLDVQWLVGWFKGVADVLGTEEKEIIDL